MWKRFALHKRSQEGGGGQGARLPIEMLPMIKMSQKRLLFLQFEFLSASSRTTVHAYKSN